MYLTRFRLNTARPHSRRLLSSPQRLHAAVMAAFPDILPTDRPQAGAPRVLWRLDRDTAAAAHLYVTSPSCPDLTHLVEEAGWPAVASREDPGWKSYNYRRFLDKLDKGTIWNFRLTANPVHTVATAKAAKDDQGRLETKRTAYLTPQHQMHWLLQRQKGSGFHIVEKPAERRVTERGDELQAVVREHRPLEFTRGKSGKVKILTATYEGRLEVTDPEAFQAALTRGIGKAKAYGCGLMTLAPTSQ